MTAHSREIRVRTRWVWLLAAACVGCQAWGVGGGAPGVTSRAGEKEIVKQAKNDPFPTPQQVGLRSDSDD